MLAVGAKDGILRIYEVISKEVILKYSLKGKYEKLILLCYLF